MTSARRALRPDGRRPPGRAPQLTLDDLVRVALEQGLAEFTISGVARELGVTHAALYRHVAGREALLLACLRHVADAMAWPPADPGAGWEGLLRGVADALWEACERFSGLALAIMTTPGAPTSAAVQLDDVVAALVAGGLRRDDAVLAVDLVSEITLSTRLIVTTMRAQDEKGRRGLDRHRDAWAAGTDSDLLPGDDAWVQRGLLDRKIDLVVAGLRAGAAG